MPTKVWLENLKGKKPFGRPCVEWENIQTDCKETRMESVHWFGLAQDRDMWRAVVATVMKLT
jgi:hypothetical protein